MKAKLTLIFLMIFLAAGFASADFNDYPPSYYANNYGYNSNYGYSGGNNYGLPFNPFNGFNLYASKNQFSQDSSNFLNGINSNSQNGLFSNFDSQNGGFSNNYNSFQNANMFSFLNSLDGYDLTVNRCTTTTRRVVIDLKGKDPKLNEFVETCGPIEGKLYKNNQVTNGFTNNLGSNANTNNQGNFANSNFNQGDFSNSEQNTYRSSNDLNQELKTVNVNFGKGNVIVY